jgi:hypothetical protein
MHKPVQAVLVDGRLETDGFAGGVAAATGSRPVTWGSHNASATNLER